MLGCSPWPSSFSTCINDDKPFKYLNRTWTNLTITDTAECQSMCLQEGDEGCCELSFTFGCRWKKKSHAIESFMSWGYYAVTCSSSGVLIF